MDATLQTHDIVIRANEKFAKLDIVADSLAVFETNSPFDLTDEKSFLFQGIDRACRLNVKKPGFQFRKMKVMRPEGVTGDIVIKFAVGDGVEFIDGRLQYTSTTANAPVFNIAAVNPLPAQPVRARFLPKYTAKQNLANRKYYAFDATAAPRVVAANASNLNLIARQDLAVTKRVVKLLSGGPVNLGVSYSETGSPGHVESLDAVGDKVTLEGGQWLFGTADSDATLSVYEVYAGTAADLADFDADAVQTSLSWPTAALEGSLSYSFTDARSIDLSNGDGSIYGGLASLPGFPSGSRYTGTLKVATGPGSTSGSGKNVFSFYGITLDEANAYKSSGQLGEVANNVYCAFALASTASGRITTSSGQTFYVPSTAQVSGGDPGRYFRLVFPFAGDAPHIEQASTYPGQPSGWVLNS